MVLGTRELLFAHLRLGSLRVPESTPAQTLPTTHPRSRHSPTYP